MRISQAALKFQSSRGAAADGEFFSPPPPPRPPPKIWHKTAEVGARGAQKAQAPLTLMALVDWHLTWCDTVAVWFISGHTLTRAQSSNVNNEELKIKKGAAERKRRGGETEKHAFPPATKCASRCWLFFSAPLCSACRRRSAQPHLTATVRATRGAVGICARTADRR